MNKPFWYQIPDSLPWDSNDETIGWPAWHKKTKAKYPIQYFFREEVTTFFGRWQCKFNEFKYKIHCFFFPRHPEIRKAIPRTWADISSLVVDVNLAMILSFKKEADESWVDWDGTPEHRKFKNWLDSAAHWVTVGRPNCLAQRDAFYPPHPLPPEMKGLTYDQLYGNVDQIEKLIDETDTNIIKQMIDYRYYMWT